MSELSIQQLLTRLHASACPLANDAAAEIKALQQALVAQARAFGQWADGATARNLALKTGANLERR